MNKIFNINLGGYPFTIDDDAYAYLTKYINSIRRHFEFSEGCEEIISDIENRIAEIFIEKLGEKPIVTIGDVKNVETIMGTPEDFGADPIEEEEKDYSSGKYKTGRKLFRDTENQTIGGVCAGLAAFFGIRNPLWIRLAFVIVTLSGGIGILAYGILWLVLPEAKTAGDKLLMRGEPINISNIARTVEQEIEDLSETLTELGNEFKSKKKSFSATHSPRKNLFTRGFSAIGKLIRGFFRLLRKIFRPFFLLILIILLVSIGVSWIALLFGFGSMLPYAGYYFAGPRLFGLLGLVNGFIAFGVPLLAVILLIVRFLTSYRMDRHIIKNMWTVWGINLVSLIFLSAGSAFSDSAKTTITSEVFEGKISTDELTVNFKDWDVDRSLYFVGNRHHDGKLFNSDIDFRVEKSPDKNFHLYKSTYSRGKTSEKAEDWANRVEHEIDLNENILTMSEVFRLNKGKFKDQQLDYILQIPTGKSIKLNRRAWRRARNLQTDESYPKPHNYEKYAWTMYDNGLVAEDFVEASQFEKAMDNKDFKKLNISGDIKVEIRKSADYSISFKGLESQINKLDIVQQKDLLNIDLPSNRSEGVLLLQINMPDLESIKGYYTEDIRIEGFSGKECNLQFEGGQSVVAYIDYENMNVLLDKDSELELIGTGQNLNLEANNSCIFDGKGFSSKTASIKGRRYEYVYLNVEESIKSSRDLSYRTKIYGSPEIEYTYK